MKPHFLLALCLGGLLMISGCGVREGETAAVAMAAPAATTAAPVIARTAISNVRQPEATPTANPALATAVAMAVTAEAQSAALLPLSTLDSVRSFDMSGYKSYAWTIVDAPDGAASSEGVVIKQGSDQEVALNLGQLSQQFPVAGVYRLRLTLVDLQDQLTVREFTYTR
jgi:hypothetical protein